VYALEGDIGAFLYVGMSEDVPGRFRDHKKGKVHSTKGHRPLKLAYVEFVGLFGKTRR
jgi:predicted GIY-YIG superfamily endonuclease